MTPRTVCASAFSDSLVRGSGREFERTDVGPADLQATWRTFEHGVVPDLRAVRDLSQERHGVTVAAHVEV